MSSLALRSEPLNRALGGRGMTRDEAVSVLAGAMDDPAELLAAAGQLRDAGGHVVTFSKKAFFNVVNLCRDSCSYCTYKAEPGSAKLSMMGPEQLEGALGMAARYGCVEALLVTGERPEESYPAARAWLRGNGYGSTAEYLAHASEAALELGLFPHTNAGNLEYGELAELQKTNVSMGLMVENSSARMGEKGMPHERAPSKEPDARMGVLEDAGRLGIPMTTGMLAGIGETLDEAVDTIFAIKGLHERFGNIQEVIVQNFAPKPDTRMRGHPPAGRDYFMALVALARVVMPAMNIQVPPNLSPHTYADYLGAGINDWGGISPLTPDYVNPEFAWPRIGALESECAVRGHELKCRFPVYPGFVGMVPGGLRDKMGAVADESWHVRGERWR